MPHQKPPSPPCSNSDQQNFCSYPNRFRELHRLSLTEHTNYDDLYADYLATGLALLDMETGVVSHIEGDAYLPLAIRPKDEKLIAGTSVPLGDVYCQRVLATANTVAVTHVAQHAELSQCALYKRTGAEAYLAAPIWVSGAIVGTLAFSDRRIRANGFSDEDRELIELMALGLGQIIDRDNLEQRRALATQKMQENINLFESAFHYAAIGMALVAPSGRWLRVNYAVTRILGYSERELLKKDFQAITHPEDLLEDLAHVKNLLDGKYDSYRMEKRYWHRNGEPVWGLLSASLVRNADGSPRYFVSQIQDITEQKKALLELERKRNELEIANQELMRLATKDSLTHLFNRRGFNERFSEELNKCARAGLPLSLLIIDVDHFKDYNDEFGHPAGDVALQKIAEVLRGSGRMHDVVARQGGEEFAVILPNTDAEGCQLVAERMRDSVAAIKVDETKRLLTVSIGGATTAPQEPQSPPVNADKLLRLADEALYAAKAAGRNRCHFSAEMAGSEITNN